MSDHSPGTPGPNTPKHGASDGGRGEHGGQEGPAHDERLERLRARLDAGKKAQVQDKKAHEASAESKKGMAQALRLSSEFIAGIVVGGAIGYLIDAVFGTSPWGLIVFLLLGFCAAVVNVLRAAGLMVQGSYKTVKSQDQAPGQTRDQAPGQTRGQTAGTNPTSPDNRTGKDAKDGGPNG